jgi:hypothetical protein
LSTTARAKALALAVGTDPRGIIFHFVQVDVEEVFEA